MHIRPTGQHLEQLQTALLDAFDHAALTRLVRYELNLELEWITPVQGERDLTTIIDELVANFASQQDGLKRLLAAACKQNPTNGLLAKLNIEWLVFEFESILQAQQDDIEDTRVGISIATNGSKVENASIQIGDVTGRDKNVCGDEVHGDKVLGDKHVHYHSGQPETPVAPPMMALLPPDDFVQRSVEFEQLISYLLTDSEKTVAITATIRGAGGFGKTTLAQAICRDERIRTAFPDGILWVTVGDDKANVLLGLRKLYHALTGKEAQFLDQYDATMQMRHLLAERRCLMVIDDVWNAAHLQPFLEGGERCARLVTTRIASVTPKEADVVTLDAMQVSEATSLLGAGLIDSNHVALATLARRLGEWPLLLRLVNRRLYDDMKQYGLSLVDAITHVQNEFDEFGLTAFDVNDAAERSQAVAVSIGISLQRLQSAASYGRTPVDEAARFLELAIFPEDTAIPLRTVALLWQQTGGLSAGATERLCRRLADLSLILRYDGHSQTILLHDVTRRYLLDRASNEQLVAWHSALLDGYRARCAAEWWQLPNDGYIYRHLFEHLKSAQQQNTIEQLLLTYRWLDAKLQFTDVVSLIRDFDFRQDQQHHAQLSLLHHALQMSIGVLTKDKDQLVSQLFGRLVGMGVQWEPFIDELRSQNRVMWLQPIFSTLTRPGGRLLYNLSGHTDAAENLLLTSDGRLISSCRNGDCTVKVWDVEKGGLLHSLEGHIDPVKNLLLTPDGRLITSCGSFDDSTVKVWDIEKGVLLHSLEGHTTGVDHLLLTPDGRLITSCCHRMYHRFDGDNTVKVWDIEQGVLLHSLEGHTTGVDNLLLTPDGRLITSCRYRPDDRLNDDGTVKVWDIEQGVLLHSLEGNSVGVNNLLLTINGRLITSCRSNDDNTVRVWDIEKGVLLHSLEGYASGVSLTPDGRLISSCFVSGDATVKVWDIEQGVLLHSLEGHISGVNNLLLTPDSRLITSCSSTHLRFKDDSTVKVWNIEKGVLLHSLEGHTSGVDNLLLTPDGRLITSCGSSHLKGDSTVKVWDIERGVLLHSLKGHLIGVDNLLLTPDGRLITSCMHDSIGVNDHTVKLWDIEQGVLLYSLVGHTAGLHNLLLTSDGKLITSCYGGGDTTVKVWDIEKEAKEYSIEGHMGAVDILLLTPGGRLITTCYDSDDSTIKIWSIGRRRLLYSLQGHTSGVSNLLLTPDGRLITSCGISGDHTVKVWDIEQGILLHSLDGHTTGVNNLLLTPDGRLITSCGISGDHTVKVWDIEQGILLHSLEGHTSDVDNLLLTPDGRLITSCNRTAYTKDCTVKVWDIEQGILLHSLEGHTSDVDNLLLIPDGRLITSCNGTADTKDCTVKVWDIENGVLVHSLESHTSGVSNLLLTPDGRLITSCGISGVNDHTVKVWDIEQGILLHSLEGHTGDVDNLLLIPDGRLITSCGNRYSLSDKDTTVKVWDVETGVLLHSLEGHKGSVANWLFTPNGRLITSCGVFSSDPSIKVWDIESGTILYSLDGLTAPIEYMILLHTPSYLVAFRDTQLNVWDWVSGKVVTRFTTDGAIHSCKQAADGTLIVGDGLGIVHFLRLIEP